MISYGLCLISVTMCYKIEISSFIKNYLIKKVLKNILALILVDLSRVASNRDLMF